MSRRKKQPKKYSDHFGRDKPLQAFQGRCENKACSIAVFDKTLLQNGGLCPFCADVLRQHRYWKKLEKGEEKGGKGKKRQSRVEKATDLLAQLTEEERELLLTYIEKEEKKQ